MGPLLAQLGLEPVQGFISEDVLKQAISTESKVFSIYATGYVRAGKRETRVRVHSVVDFRGAPAPTAAPSLDPSGANPLAGAQAGGLAGAGVGAAATQGSGADDQQQIGNTLKPYPGGRVVYFRID